MAKSGENHGLGECAIPGPVASETINKFALNKPADGAKEIREYLKYQARGERVLHLEKVMVEKLVARTLEVWDVKTSRDRYWVITSPTNLYSQALFPSADYTLSFHVGLTDRMNARQTPCSRQAKGQAGGRMASTGSGVESRRLHSLVGVRCRHPCWGIERVRSARILEGCFKIDVAACILADTCFKCYAPGCDAGG